MRLAVTEMEQAIHGHEQWIEDIVTCLICHLPPDERDLGEDAHRRCRFGQWYYSSGLALLGDQSGFEEIEVEHEQMHRHASVLLRASRKGEPIALPDYERFINALKRTRLEILSVRHQLTVALYNTDPLTGIAGRVDMLQKLRENQELAKRSGRPCVVAMMDVDRFKSVNDLHGHQVGDQVLIAIARHARMHLRPYDAIFRYGGEEFLICLPDTDIETGFEICDRMRRELDDLVHAARGKECFRVTVSAGITAVDPDCPVEEAINRADRALLDAKAAGRDRVCIWSPPPAEAPAEIQCINGRAGPAAAAAVHSA